MNSVGMNMNGINPTAAMNAMPNGANGIKGAGDSEMDIKTNLNTCIYDYLLKNEQYDAARALNKNVSFGLNTSNTPLPRRPNGAEDGGEDSKEDIDTKKPPDLPYAKVPPSYNDNSFLLDWFQLFWEMWMAPRQGKPADAVRFMEHTKAQSKMRQEQQSQILRQPNMMPGAMQQNYQNMMRGVQPGMLARAQQNSMRNMNPQQQMMMARQQQIMQQQQQMERAGSEVDMNGRPRTPSSGDNAPSPKRARIEGQFPGQQGMPNGRFAPGMSGQQMMNNQINAQALLKQNNIDLNGISQTGYNTFQQQPAAVQQRSLDVYSQTLAAHQRKNLAQMNGQGNPMMQPGMEPMEFYPNNMRPQMAQNGGGQGSSNHALQDYQMQLMLLEQQNKKRLLMARQEQDNNNIRPDGAPAMPGQPGFAPNMSPSGSRNGPSPNPSEQMKRGTPKLNQVGLPGSPMPDGSMPHGRGSPGPMNFNNGMGMDMMQAMKGGEGIPMGQNGMRPPSSHPAFSGGPINPQQMEVYRQAQAAQAAQANRMPNGANWPQGPQGQAPNVPQAAQGQNAPAGTPQARNAAMPPPQNVPAANNNANNANGRPASPAQSAAAGTPQTSNKPTPANKKGKADKAENRKRSTKKASTAAAATPSAENESAASATTPSTPITSMHPKSFNDSNKSSNAPQTQATTTQANSNVPAPAPQVLQQQDPSAMMPFDGMAGFDSGGMDFKDLNTLDTGDVLENFDFDAFLESGDGNDFNEVIAYGNFDGLEAGAGDA